MSRKTKAARIEEQVMNLIGEQAGLSDYRMTPATALDTDLGLDSLDRVELTMRLEEEVLEFSEPIDEERAESWRTVGDVVTAMQELA